jgi:hypothetical protein
VPIILHVIHSSGGTRCCRALSVGDVEAAGEDIVVVVLNDWETSKLTERIPSVGLANRDRRQDQAPETCVGGFRLLIIAASLPAIAVSTLKAESHETRHAVLL